MKKSEIAQELARQSGITEAAAADRLDRLVREILANLRRGKPSTLPGIGKFLPRPQGGVRFEREGKPGRD
jgi:nucleoid DNA-binding protein